MNSIISFAFVSFLVCTVTSASCPEKYSKITPDHTYCLKPNEDCQVISKGIKDKAEIAEILDAHNINRSKVAMGQERGAGGLPQAANMMELTWDQELADIAQKWADQCKFAHDCNKCRAIPRGRVGQNVAYMGYFCSGEKCTKQKADWKRTVEMWYNEVDNFDKSMVKSVNIKKGKGGKAIGHFTQVAWAKTSRIGCGYISYPDDEGWGTQLYVCNYFPGGNMRDAPLYIEGAPCSQCPGNTCCGNTCQGGKIYPGLCREN